MKTIKHYNVELDLNTNDNTIEYFSTTLSYTVETFEIGDIKDITVYLPKTDLVDLIENEFGKKSLKWFEGLYKKLEKEIIEK